MKDWFFRREALISALLFFSLAALDLFLGIREQHTADFLLALLTLAVGIVNLFRYRKK